MHTGSVGGARSSDCSPRLLSKHDRVNVAGGPRVFLNIEDHNSFNDPRGPTFNTDLHVSPALPRVHTSYQTLLFSSVRMSSLALKEKQAPWQHAAMHVDFE